MFAMVPFAMRAKLIVGRGKKGEKKKLEKYSYFEAARNFADKVDGRIVEDIRKKSKNDVSTTLLM